MTHDGRPRAMGGRGLGRDGAIGDGPGRRAKGQNQREGGGKHHQGAAPARYSDGTFSGRDQIVFSLAPA